MRMGFSINRHVYDLKAPYTAYGSKVIKPTRVEAFFNSLDYSLLLAGLVCLVELRMYVCWFLFRIEQDVAVGVLPACVTANN